MAKIAHLSDIHFGANDPRILAATEAWLIARQPDLVISAAISLSAPGFPSSGTRPPISTSCDRRASSCWLSPVMPIGTGGELSEAVGHHFDAARAICEAGVDIAQAGHFHHTYAEAAGKWSSTPVER